MKPERDEHAARYYDGHRAGLPTAAALGALLDIGEHATTAVRDGTGTDSDARITSPESRGTASL